MAIRPIDLIPQHGIAAALEQRWDAAEVWPAIGACYLNFVEDKGTIYCPDRTPQGLRIIDRFANSPVVQEVSRRFDMPIRCSLSGGYVDLGHTKDRGLDRLASLGVLRPVERTFAFFDSENDIGIVEHVRRASSAGGSDYRLFFVGDELPDCFGGTNDSHLFCVGGGPTSTANILQAIVERRPIPGIRAEIDSRPLPQCRIVADMTKTMLEQFPPDFPTQGPITAAIQAGVEFVLATGDDETTALQFFALKPIKNPYYVVSSGGGRISRVQNGNTQLLWKCQPLTRDTRLALIEEAARIIAENS